MKRILIDGRFIGVGDSQTRYVLELVKEIISIDNANQYRLLIRPAGLKSFCDFFQISKSELQTLPAGRQVSNKNSDISKSIYHLPSTIYQNLQLKVLDIKHYSIAEQTKLLKYLNEEKFDLVHFTQFNHPVRYRGKYVVTIQDMTLFGHLHRQNIIKRVAFGSVMKSATRNSAKIICISKTTMDEVIDYFKVPKDKFEITYLGIDHKNYNMNVKSRSNEIDKFMKKYDITDDYILYTGMWKKHKNLIRLLKAYEVFSSKYQVESSKDSLIKLVLVGKPDKKEKEVLSEIERINKSTNQQFNGSAIVTTGYIDEEELPIAYAGAFAYCMPSLSEGFGWPPLEAMACGTPVISSKESCMPEILGDAPLYFDAYNVEDIAQSIKTVTSDTALRKELIKKGLEQVKKYNWEECAKKTLKVYQDLLS